MSEDNSDLVLRLEDVRRELEKLKEIEKDLEDAILAAVDEGDVTDGDGEVLAVVESPLRFSAEKAKQLIPANLLPLVQDDRISAAKVKKLLPAIAKLLPDVKLDYDMFREKTDNRRVRILGDD